MISKKDIYSLVASIVICVVFFVAFYKPQHDALILLEEESNSNIVKLDYLKDNQKLIYDYVEKSNVLDYKAFSLKNRFIEEGATSDFFIFLYSLFKDFNLSSNSISYGNPEKSGNKTSVVFTFTCSGKGEDLRKFIQILTNSGKEIIIGNISITKLSGNQFTCNMSLSVFAIQKSNSTENLSADYKIGENETKKEESISIKPKSDEIPSQSTNVFDKLTRK